MRPMLRRLLPALAMLIVVAPLAHAQEEAAEEEAGRNKAWGVFVGSIQGAEVTNQSIFGLRPEIDDSFVFGGLLRVEASGIWVMETRLGLSSTKFLDMPDLEDPVNNPPREVDADLFYLDVALVPTFEWGKVTFGIPFGVGWAGTSSDGDLSSFLPGRDIDLKFTDGSGPQYFAGVQAHFPVGSSWGILLDARYHRFHRLTNVIEQNANMPEFSVGITRSF
jgi:hypothetical protein